MSSDFSDIYSQASLLASSRQWTCPKCSFNNPITNHFICEVCNQVNFQLMQSLVNTSSLKPNWSCPACTLKNNVNNVFCECCYQARLSLENNSLNSIGKIMKYYIPRTISARSQQYQIELDTELKYQEKISICKMTKTHFIDDEFSHSNRSLGSNTFRNASQWLRIFDISPTSNSDHLLSWSIMSSPSPIDIQQGALGNCWLMAALALITERPRILRYILLTKNVNNEGVYLVRICKNGLWETIIIDDYFPCTKQKQLVFSRVNRRQLFAPLIEKACAKLFGSYANLIAGNMLEGLQLLTGAPCEFIRLDSSNRRLDYEIIWAKLLSALESNLLIGAATGRDDIDSNEYSRVRIWDNHAFSILAAYQLSDCSSRFVLVRDPHARSNYTDKRVTSDILNRLKLVNNTPRSDGAFWIYWPTFTHFFSSITISTYNEDHFDIRHEGEFTRSSTQHVPAYHFHLSETSSISISLINHRENRNTRLYHTQSFVLCDIVDEEFPLGGIGRHENILRSHQGSFTYWTGILPPGNYVVIPFSVSFWRQTSNNINYTFVVHSSIPIDVTVKLQPPTLLADCLISAVVKKYHIITEGKHVTYYLTPNEIESMLCVVENWSPNLNLSINAKISHSRNLQHSRSSSITHDCIPPYCRQLIFINEWIGDNNSLPIPECTVDYAHTTETTDAKPAIDTFSDDIHTPRLF